MKKKKGLNFLDKIMLLVALVMAVSLVLGFSAGQFDPRQHGLIPFFGLAYPYILFVNVVLVAWWLIRSKWLLAIGTVALIFVGWTPLHATFSFSGTAGEARKADSSYLRLLTYNVHNFKVYGGENNKEIKEKMFRTVEAENPDVVCFQEFYTRNKGPYNNIDTLKKRLGMRHHYFNPSMKNDYESIGLAIFSRYPIRGKGNILFDEAIRGNESIYADLSVGKQTVRIYNVHLQSIGFDKNDYDYMDRMTHKIGTELKPSKKILIRLRNAFRKRSEQVDVLKQNISTCQTPYVIAGDFNDTPASYAVTELTHSLHNAFAVQGKGFGKTYNGKFPNFQIDYIACSKALDVKSYRIIEARLSDHFPVRSDLEFKASAE
ncbi:endonuclease/exonuclease/phosphatase family protein [Pedobacter sp. SYP-B3415]|uniref:endonuclease/exonuclease/phosphatase family protein n=1 Tax=Pedobacter sp. SYP-B3415 TaxID=2496641 RepID=UPI00101B7EBD|nr:endonuclease/exonuclease/phosphatase family protein [Pedobacter sp. SYP-B3415]